MTSVATFANYQLISTRAIGPGWVMVGDAFGFVDPMLSPGVFLALRSSELVADALAPLVCRHAVPSPAEVRAALDPYVKVYGEILAAWTELVGYFYGGQMMALMRAGQDWMRARSGAGPRAVQRHIERHVGAPGLWARHDRALQPRARALPEPPRAARRRAGTARDPLTSGAAPSVTLAAWPRRTR